MIDVLVRFEIWIRETRKHVTSRVFICILRGEFFLIRGPLTKRRR